MKKLALLALIATAASSATSLASAGAIRFTQGGTVCTLNDNGPASSMVGCSGLTADSSSQVGLINISGTVGGFDVTSNTGRSTPIVGSVGLPALDLLFGAYSTVAGTLTIEFTDTGFNAPSVRNVFAQIGGTTAGTSVSYATYADLSNVAFGRGVTLSAMNFVSTPFSAGITAAFNPGLATYSLTQVITIVHGNGRSLTTGDAAIDVPEPATALLLGSAIAGLCIGRRKAKSAK